VSQSKLQESERAAGVGTVTVAAYNAQFAAREKAEAERDRYREALEDIARRSPFGTSSEAAVIALAREALDG
jgi:hypothetical protein